MGLSLVALDTDHIKEYVFATDKLKEIRGASSLLDRLNRQEMTTLAKEVDVEAECVYAHGGAGLFLLSDTKKAEKFGRAVQQKYRTLTGGRASITFAVQELPDTVSRDVWNAPLKNELELLNYRLHEAKGHPSDPLDFITIPSHPFIRPCDSCGVEYAEGKDKTGGRDPDEQDALYCMSCLLKRIEDNGVKEYIDYVLERERKKDSRVKDDSVQEISPSYIKSPLWDNIIGALRNINYWFPRGTKRPNDFNVFRNFKGAKDYIGLIYADANSMGKKLSTLYTLKTRLDFAVEVDDAICRTVCDAIEKYLRVGQHRKQGDNSQEPMFPFDILLMGGDDVIMVTPASAALDVALMIGEKFHDRTGGKHMLSIGVLLAPVKYPFGLQLGLVEDTLKFAKKEGSRVSTRVANKTKYGDTRINFMVVTGSTSQSFDDVYQSLRSKKEQVSGHKGDVEFYATLRPYDPEQLDILLKAIHEGNREGLGRTKLHQLREAILKKNLKTSVVDGLALLRNWKEKQRMSIIEQLHKFGRRYQEPHSDPRNPASDLPRVIFPWFADGKNTYRTSLLDFVELYDFVGGEEVESGAES